MRIIPKAKTGPQQIEQALGLFEKIKERLRAGVDACLVTMDANATEAKRLADENEVLSSDVARGTRAIEKLTEITGA